MERNIKPNQNGPWKLWRFQTFLPKCLPQDGLRIGVVKVRRLIESHVVRKGCAERIHDRIITKIIRSLAHFRLDHTLRTQRLWHEYPELIFRLLSIDQYLFLYCKTFLLLRMGSFRRAGRITGRRIYVSLFTAPCCIFRRMSQETCFSSTNSSSSSSFSSFSSTSSSSSSSSSRVRKGRRRTETGKRDGDAEAGVFQLEEGA